MYGKLPGPGHYKDRQFGSNIDGGRFSTASPLNFRQEAERRSEQLPAPWDYHVPAQRNSVPQASTIDLKILPTRAKPNPYLSFPCQTCVPNT